jgi:hypothetical protein
VDQPSTERARFYRAADMDDVFLTHAQIQSLSAKMHNCHIQISSAVTNLSRILVAACGLLLKWREARQTFCSPEPDGLAPRGRFGSRHWLQIPRGGLQWHQLNQTTGELVAR